MAADGALLDALEGPCPRDETRPGLTLLIDVLPPEMGLARAKALRDAATGSLRGGRSSPFHERLEARRFLAIARSEPGRVLTVDAMGPVDVVAATITDAVEARYDMASLR